ncbi:hypothetical protein HZH66_012495 [Vespula vulgaris]|uniref:Uncharacterized protein n=1 Tax=Vespula vulgaris TaxID=7454 RepID=A0A834MTT3_VESVU|nr:hypothetical protein HZH66_012495 [Vespula vulgaris]
MKTSALFLGQFMDYSEVIPEFVVGSNMQKHPLDHYGRIEIRRRFQLPPVRTTFIEIRELTERRANEQDEAADYRPAERRLHRSRRSREPMAKLPLPFRKTG